MQKNIKIGFIITDSFYNLKKIIAQIKILVHKGAKILPIIDSNAKIPYKIQEEIEYITSNKILKTKQAVALIGRKYLIDIIIIAPCSENTLSKLANGCSDTLATLAVGLHLKNSKNVVIGISAKDGLSSNASNLGLLLNRKNYYFIPFKQSNPLTSPNSLIFDINYLIPTIEKALKSEQIQPLLAW